MSITLQEFLDQAYAEQGEASGGFMGTGLDVKPVDTDVIDFKLWYRGKVTTQIDYR